MKPSDYGLIFHRGLRPLYFTSYEIIEEPGGTKYIIAQLASGGQIEVHRYFSKRKNKMIEAEKAIYRQPNVNLQEMLLSTQTEEENGQDM